MKSALFTLLTIAAFNCPGQAKIKNEANPYPKTNTLTPSEYFNVSLINLIANPEKYDGKVIQVTGYLNLEFEGNAIYLHKEDFDHALTGNGLWVSFSEKIKNETKVSDFSKKYVIIVGKFDMKSHGHMGLFGGTISNITRLDNWR